MNKFELSEESLNPISHSNNSQLPANIQVNLKKSRQRQHTSFLKENQSKHMNAIKPFVSNAKERERKISKRQSQKNLPVGMPVQYESSSKNKSKKDLSSKKVIEDSVSSKNIGDLYTELITIKSEYRALKNSYNGLLKEKNEITERGEKESANIQSLKVQIERVRRQEEKSRNNLKFVQQEIERIKKQCVKIVEAQKFKNKKLEETIQQKQLMIAFLRSQLAVLNGEQAPPSTGFFFQHTAPTFIKNSNIINMEPQMLPSKIIPTISINKSLINNSVISSIENNSEFTAHEIVDLPRQMNYKQRQNYEDQLRVIPRGSDIKPEENFYQEKQPKREYIFSNEDDSLNFSYEKQVKDNQFESVESSDPTVLTFTKKDVYILDEQPSQIFGVRPFERKSQLKVESKIQDYDYHQKATTSEKVRKIPARPVRNQKKKTKSIEDQSEKEDYTENSGSQNEISNEQRSNFTGQEEILTFQNRFAQKNTHKELMKIIGPHLNQKKKSSNGKSQKEKEKIKAKHGPKGIAHTENINDHEKRQISSKSKLQTKRVQANEHQAQLGQEKQSSAETKKPSDTSGHPKGGKKKISRKRKSEQGGSLIRR